jgi:hypothetical protein
VRAWRGNPADPATQTSGVGWILAAEWVPYQRPTFVTPAFAGYVSGHSTFSRAAAEVMTAMTGGAYFPGGLSEWTVPAGELVTEQGPTGDVTLQWVTYYDAAAQAGISRIFGGSTSAPTTSRAAASARPAAGTRGRWPCATSAEPPYSPAACPCCSRSAVSSRRS